MKKILGLGLCGLLFLGSTNFVSAQQTASAEKSPDLFELMCGNSQRTWKITKATTSGAINPDWTNATIKFTNKKYFEWNRNLKNTPENVEGTWSYHPNDAIVALTFAKGTKRVLIQNIRLDGKAGKAMLREDDKITAIELEAAE